MKQSRLCDSDVLLPATCCFIPLVHKFPKVNMHKDHVEHLLKHNILGPKQRDSDSVNQGEIHEFVF